MSTFSHITLAPVALFTALIVAGAAMAPGRAADADVMASAASPGAPLSCEIQKSARAGGVQLLAVVRSDSALGGDYMFSVASSAGGNASTVNQGGPFMADAGKATTVGNVMLGAGSSYKATLTVTAGGQTIACSDPSAT